MQTFSTAERQIAKRLGETGERAGIDPDEARRRLEVLFWAEREAGDLADCRHRNELEHDRRRGTDRRAAAAGWLEVGDRAARSVLGAAVVVLLILTLAGLWATGHLDPSVVMRLIP